MEVKIKQGSEMLDATIEMVEGVMVVLPKEVKVEPKDGDVFCVDSLYPCVGIVTEEYSYGKPDKDRLYFSVGYWKQSGNMQLGPFCACNRNTEPNYRPATEEEKKKLFDTIAEEGYEFDFDKKELVKLKWKPKLGETYFSISGSTQELCIFRPFEYKWCNDSTDNKLYELGRCFMTEEECHEFCNRLNNAINSVKP